MHDMFLIVVKIERGKRVVVKIESKSFKSSAIRQATVASWNLGNGEK